ncbi:hypothetical protein ACIBP6_23685 [Nonomuraea terrae]|uniref:hypothetical protein n=1 Tax=Nonomuraea terrae TaxID=2530383 RepID=UPI00378AD478
MQADRLLVRSPTPYPAAGHNAFTNRCEIKADLKKGWLNKLLTASNVLARIQGMKNVTSKCITVLGLAYVTVACGYGSPASGGLTGVTVNADGQLTMVASWCGNAPDGVVVHRRAAGELLEHADIKAPSMTGGIMSMNLEEMPAGWSLQEGSLDFEDGQTYLIAAYSLETHTRFADAYFTTQSKQKIAQGEVMIPDHSTTPAKDAFLTEGEFVAQAEHQC